eukprot:1155033-Pelagomonas_calceolata.AAC.1
MRSLPVDLQHELFPWRAGPFSCTVSLPVGLAMGLPLLAHWKGPGVCHAPTNVEAPAFSTTVLGCSVLCYHAAQVSVAHALCPAWTLLLYMCLEALLLGSSRCLKAHLQAKEAEGAEGWAEVWQVGGLWVWIAGGGRGSM